jgi:hypothetical protein
VLAEEAREGEQIVGGCASRGGLLARLCHRLEDHHEKEGHLWRNDLDLEERCV